MTDKSSIRVERLPFTVYDVIGYLIPGVLFLFLINDAMGSTNMTGKWARDLTLTILASREATVGSQVFAALILLFMGYVAGHIISYFAAETIERVNLLLVGFPSGFLLESSEDSFRTWSALRRIFSRSSRDIHDPRSQSSVRLPCWKFGLFVVWRLVLLIAFAPYAMLMLLLDLLGLTQLLAKPLDKELVDRFNKQFGSKYDVERNSSSSVKFRIIEYYVDASSALFHQRKYNYVILYGFTRNVSLALYVIWIVMVWTNCAYMQHLPVLGGALALFLSYLKFWRRYSQETILGFCALLDTEASDSNGAKGEK